MKPTTMLFAVAILGACGGGSDPVVTATTGSIRGTVADHTGATVANVAVALTGNAQADRSTSSGVNGVYTFADVPPGTYTVTVTPPAGFSIGAAGTASVTVAGGAQANASPIVLKRDGIGEWGQRAGLLVANSEFALAESNGKIYVMGGYPSSRVTSRTVQIYDIASDRWNLGPELPLPNNHGMAAAVNGKIYLIGGQFTDDQEGATAVDRVYELEPAKSAWVEKARMPTARSGINGVMARGCFHVWGGEAPTGMTPDHDYYDPRTDRWSSLLNMPTPVHGVVGSAFVDGLIWVTGGGTQIGGASGSQLNQTYRPEVSCE